MLAEGDAPPALMARQALIVQLACLRVAAHPGWASVVTRRVAPARRAAADADIAATADLVALTQPRPRLPPWRIVVAENPATLRADYRAAQAATGVGWSYLAAVNFVETDFGRVAGPSSAGAQGPMQFMPAIWAVYGHGNIHLPAMRSSPPAGSWPPVARPTASAPPCTRTTRAGGTFNAVLRYARRLRADPQALMGYYRRQVVYRLASGWVLLPAGYGIDPAVQAIPVRI